jgi:hypothetical protein
MANEKEVKVIVSAEDKTGPAFKSASKNANLFNKDVSNVGSALTKLGTALGGFYALKKVGDFIGNTTAEFDESVKQATKLEFLLKKNTDATDEQVKSLTSQAQAMQDVGVIGNDVIVALQAQLATFELNTDTIKKMTPAIADMIVAEKGINATTSDMISFGNAFGMAMEGNYASLTKRGFKIDEATKKIIELGTEEEKAAAITKYLSDTYGGLNEQMAETSQGKMVNLQNKFADFREEIGNLNSFFRNELVESISMITDDLANMLPDDLANNWNKKIAKLWNDLSFGVTNIFPLIADEADRFWNKIFGQDQTGTTNFQDELIKNMEDFEKKWEAAGKGTIAINSEEGESLDKLSSKYAALEDAKDLANKMKSAFETVSSKIIKSFESQTNAVSKLKEELKDLDKETSKQLQSAEESYKSQLTSQAISSQKNIESINKQIDEEKRTMSSGWRTRIKELEDEKAKEQSIINRIKSEGIDASEAAAKDELTILKEKHLAEIAEIKSTSEEKKKLAEDEIEQRNKFIIQQGSFLSNEGIKNLVTDEMSYAGKAGYGAYSYVFNFNGDVNDKDALMKTIVELLNRQSTLKEYAGQ